MSADRNGTDNVVVDDVGLAWRSKPSARPCGASLRSSSRTIARYSHERERARPLSSVGSAARPRTRSGICSRVTSFIY
jgi:hypothetical protein